MTPPAHARRLLAAPLLALAGAAALAAGPAAAEPLAVSLSVRAGRVAAAVDLGPALPTELEGRLGNGLRNVIAVFVAVAPLDGGAATVAQASVIEVLYDVWEETWTVTVRDPASPAGRREVVRTAARLHQLLAHAADADLGPAAGLPAARFTVDVRVDVNPISPELLARTREYLAGSAGPSGSSRSVLGAVAGFLLREPEDGESFLFRSAPLAAPAVQP